MQTSASRVFPCPPDRSGHRVALLRLQLAKLTLCVAWQPDLASRFRLREQVSAPRRPRVHLDATTVSSALSASPSEGARVGERGPFVLFWWQYQDLPGAHSHPGGVL